MIGRFTPGFLLALGLAAATGLASSTFAQAPSAPGTAALTPEMQTQKDLRGPALPESELSELTPQAREKAASVEIEEAAVSPFSTVAKAPEETAAARPLTEEQKIRRVLSAMRVGGLSGSSDNRRILIGSMSLGQGDELPKLFATQAEKLRVRSITDRQVVLEFVEKEDGRPPRTIGLSFDLSASVNSLLPGEAFVKVVPLDGEGAVKLPPLSLEPANAALKAATNQNLHSLVERPIELLNAPAVLKADEKKKP